MKNRGFAVSGILYTILLMFMVLIVMLLFNLQNKKVILDELRYEVVRAVEQDNEVDVLREELNNLKSDKYIFINSHPVGSIYVTIAPDEDSVAAMESKYEDTKWEAYGAGRTLIGVGSNGTTTYETSGSTGGNETHNHGGTTGGTTLTAAQSGLPAHSHTISYRFVSNNKINDRVIGYTTGNAPFGISDTSITDNNTTQDATAAHNHTISGANNLPPYITVYMYKRIK